MPIRLFLVSCLLFWLPSEHAVRRRAIYPSLCFVSVMYLDFGLAPSQPNVFLLLSGSGTPARQVDAGCFYCRCCSCRPGVAASLCCPCIFSSVALFLATADPLYQLVSGRCKLKYRNPSDNQSNHQNPNGMGDVDMTRLSQQLPGTTRQLQPPISANLLNSGG